MCKKNEELTELLNFKIILSSSQKTARPTTGVNWCKSNKANIIFYKFDRSLKYPKNLFFNIIMEFIWMALFQLVFISIKLWFFLLMDLLIPEYLKIQFALTSKIWVRIKADIFFNLLKCFLLAFTFIALQLSLGYSVIIISILLICKAEIYLNI